MAMGLKTVVTCRAYVLKLFFPGGGVKVRLSTAGNFSAVFQPYLGVLSSYFFEKNFQKSQPYFLGVLSRISSFEGGIKSP